MRAIVSIIVASLALSGPLATGLHFADPQPPLGPWAQAEADLVTVGDGYRQPRSPGETGSAGPELVQSVRAPACSTRDTFDVVAVQPCATAPAAATLTCADGSAPVDPLWTRRRATVAAPWQDWQLVDQSWCTTAAGPTPEMVLTELRRLPLPAPTLTVQPDRGWVLVNMDTVVYADPAPATLTTTLLGVPVTIVATPATFTWDFADGTTRTTSSPGHPWPHQDVAHVYSRVGAYQVTLTTTWTATYTLGADPTVRTVPGTATTTTTSAPFTAEERHAHLVTGTCDDDPHAPGC